MYLLHTNPLYSGTVVCGGKPMDRIYEKCCKGKIFEKKHGITICCGDGVYHPLADELCIKGVRTIPKMCIVHDDSGEDNVEDTLRYKLNFNPRR